MTKQERSTLRLAIGLIHGGDDYMKGMRLLCDLAGIRYLAGEIASKMEPVSIQELAARPNTTFTVRERDTEQEP